MAEKENDTSGKDAQGAQPAGDEGGGDEKEDEGLATYPLVVQCDINPEWSEDVIDKVNSYFEKLGTDFEVFAKTIKTYMDEKYAVEGKWNIVVGDSFSIDMFCNKVTS
ncbi:hypothetical protein BV898_05203 [Hypsibius exemplaris]|uniref:Dynein light chain n=1 Tax=Hypsibius exemplaris TaxID=2072580 RepID=A0A1W0X070_HYPEX|nr:hypothetical protein BV898_05203 [Hypsibius exemplaris]